MSRVFLALPTYNGFHHTVCLMGTVLATRRHPLQIAQNQSSLLGQGFNILWAMAVTSGAEYFAMLHGDCGPDPA